jgi:nicotinamide mononucleotide transporter
MIDFFINAYKNASALQILLETIAFVFGILSVWYAKKEHIAVYPTGLIATTITVYLLYNAHYLGDMIINLYFSIMSIYGWYNWKKQNNNNNLRITQATPKEQLYGFGFFMVTIIVVIKIYNYFGYPIKIDNYFDILASGIFFTAMWYMANKKIENWILWIIGNSIVVPLYAYRGLGMLALQYIIFTILAVLAYIEWKKHLNQ